jgi:hypothetical protein
MENCVLLVALQRLGPTEERPSMPTLLDRIRAAIAGTPREFWPKTVATHAQAGAWDLIEALTALRELQEPTPCGAPPQQRWRLPPRTRATRWDERPALPSGRWTDRMSLDATLDWGVSDGAARTLALVVSLAGGAGRTLVTLTCSIARQLGRTARTVQNHWNALVAAGYITRATDRRSGLSTITVTDLVKPPPMPEKPKQWPRLPRPLAGWRRVAKGGAKLAAQIKAKVLPSAAFTAVVQAAEVGFGVQPHPA